MIGNVHTLTSTPAAALHKAAMRVRRATRGLRARAQMRLNPAAATRSDIVGASVIPTVRYRDVPKAVDWLCRAFGMKVHRVVKDADGAARYAELTVGAGMLMVAPIEDTAFGKMMVQPDEIGGVETQVCYLCVGDARAHAARAKKAGAVVIIDPDDEVNKGRGYSCRDPEGHVWNFGTYDPWGKQPPAAPAAAPAPRWSVRRLQQAFAVLVVLAVAATAVTKLMPQRIARAGTAVAASQVEAPQAKPEGGKAVTKVAALTLAPEPMKADPPAAAPADEAVTPALAPVEASVHQVALAAAEKSATAARAQLAEIRGALAKAEREATVARSQLEELQRAKLAAERAATDARTQLAAVQRTAERARTEVTQQRTRRVTAAARAAPKPRRSAYSTRPRSRYWCYNGEAAPPRGGGLLSGFCKG